MPMIKKFSYFVNLKRLEMNGDDDIINERCQISAPLPVLETLIMIRYVSPKFLTRLIEIQLDNLPH
jgi:hypothetical protein